MLIWLKFCCAWKQFLIIVTKWERKWVMFKKKKKRGHGNVTHKGGKPWKKSQLILGGKIITYEWLWDGLSINKLLQKNYTDGGYWCFLLRCACWLFSCLSIRKNLIVIMERINNSDFLKVMILCVIIIRSQQSAGSKKS